MFLRERAKLESEPAVRAARCLDACSVVPIGALLMQRKRTGVSLRVPIPVNGFMAYFWNG